MTATDLSNKLTAFITWAVSSPFAFLLWLTAAMIAVGLGLGSINAMLGTKLPTFGVQPQQAIYTAGIVYLLHGRV